MNAFHALSDPTRRQIVEMLVRGERTAGAIVDKFDVSAPAVSQHLKVLREARLVRVRVNGQQRIYSIDPDGLAEIEAWVKRVREYWTASLDALERELRKPESSPKKRRKR